MIVHPLMSSITVSANSLDLCNLQITLKVVAMHATSCKTESRDLRTSFCVAT